MALYNSFIGSLRRNKDTLSIKDVPRQQHTQQDGQYILMYSISRGCSDYADGFNIIMTSR